jgi:hypothetical protein
MELVKETAEASACFIDSTLSSWELKAAKFQQAWGRVPHNERVAIDKQWEARVN